MDDLRLEALQLARGQSPTPSNITRVGRATSPEASSWAFGQWELRRRARAKFALAEEMLFTREALEQATHEEVARYHASRFPASAVVADLTAGIGADLVALARHGARAEGFELDQERAEYARWNLRVHGVEADVRVEDSTSAVGEFEYAFADPARRVDNRRTLDPAEFSPNPSELAESMQALVLGGLKLSPLLPDEFLEGLGGRLEFVSYGAECKEALVWLGEVEVGRQAVHVESGQVLQALEDPPVTDEPGDFFFEADPAAVRAHCLATLCEEFDLEALADTNGYLTGSAPAASPFLKGYRVLYHGRADEKETLVALRKLDAAAPELKQRGTKLDLQALAKKFKLSGQRQVYVAVWAVEQKLKHTVLERI